MGVQLRSGSGPALRRLTRATGRAALALAGFAGVALAGFGGAALAGFAAGAHPAPGSLPPPVGPTCITSRFGPRVLAGQPVAGTFHHGIDLRAPPGAAVRAVAAGQVIGMDRRGAGGLEVRVRHAGFTALYAHLGMLAPALLRGRRTLAAGEKIGVVGRSGLEYGPHLYFELSVDGFRVDPAAYLKVAACR